MINSKFSSNNSEMDDFYVFFPDGGFPCWLRSQSLQRRRLVTRRLGPILLLTSVTSQDILRPLERGEGHLLLRELGVVRD